jgi:thioredoxin 1
MSHVLPITAKTFQSEVLESPIPVLVDLYATWCAPCRMMAPVLDRLAVELEGQVKIVKIDTDQQPELAEAFRVSSIPMLALIKDGKVVNSSVGLVSPEQVRQMVKKVMPPARPPAQATGR